MKPLVVDAGVAAKWFFPEEGTPAAMRLLRGKRRLLAPDLIWSEFGNIAWKHHRRGLIDDEELAAVVREFLTLPLEIYPARPLLPAAVELAAAWGRTVYDSLYLALAVDVDGVLVTADERTVHALAATSLARYVRPLHRRQG